MQTTDATPALSPTLVESEFSVSRAERPGASDAVFWGALVQVRHLLTGEHRRYIRSRGLFGRVVPKQDLDFREGGWGALELALRFSYLDLNGGGVQGGTLNDVSVGANWYPFSNVRFMANYIHAHRSSVGDANIFQMRLGVDY